ncbi:YdeI family protein [Arthrobacter sp. JSM 101049]|uniref:YdeI/OmpD-associated family protein n=1 Tax=Arthrobacter sp. JSM 101049 TaxID=929097 RepID=UPI003564641A
MATPLPELLLPDAATWRTWLEEHHASSPGVRLVLHKKGGTVTGLTRAAALDEALCFGWIDGQAGSRDEESYLLRFTPRRPGSAWSAINVRLVDRLAGEGRMTAAGTAEVQAARTDGRWEAAYSGPASAQLPPELVEALEGHPVAQEACGRLNGTNRYALYYRIHTLKRPESKVRKAAEFVEMLERGQAPYAQPGFTEAPKRTRKGV